MRSEHTGHGPYIITTERRSDEHPAAAYISRRAVATLEEAPDVVQSDLSLEFDAFEQMRDDMLDLPESGGTVGPLPDGTEIVVEQRGWFWLARAAGVPFRSGDQRSPTNRAEVLDAFNEREARRV